MADSQLIGEAGADRFAMDFSSTVLTAILSGGLSGTLANVFLHARTTKQQRVQARIQQAEELSTRIFHINSLSRSLIEDIDGIKIGHVTYDEIDELRRKYDRGTIIDLSNRDKIGVGDDLQRARMLARFYFPGIAGRVEMIHDEYYQLFDLGLAVLNDFVRRKSIDPDIYIQIDKHISNIIQYDRLVNDALAEQARALTASLSLRASCRVIWSKGMSHVLSITDAGKRRG